MLVNDAVGYPVVTIPSRLRTILLWIMERADSKNAIVNKRQFWHGSTFRQHNKPIALWSGSVIEQKINYTYESS